MELLNSIYNSTSSRRVLLLLLCSLTSFAQYNTPFKKNLFTLNFSFQCQGMKQLSDTTIRWLLFHTQIMLPPYSTIFVHHHSSFYFLCKKLSQIYVDFSDNKHSSKKCYFRKKKKKEIQSAVWIWKQMGTTIRKKRLHEQHTSISPFLVTNEVAQVKLSHLEKEFPLREIPQNKSALCWHFQKALTGKEIFHGSYQKQELVRY